MTLNPQLREVGHNMYRFGCGRPTSTTTPDEEKYEIYGYSVLLRGDKHFYPNTVSLRSKPGAETHVLRIELGPKSVTIVQDSANLFEKGETPKLKMSYAEIRKGIENIPPEALARWQEGRSDFLRLFINLFKDVGL